MTSTTSTALRIRVISLEEADRDENSRSLYVLNNAKLDNKLRRQLISLDSSTIIQLMDSQFPQDISADASRKDILSNPVFRRCVQAGYIRLANPEDVEALRANPEYLKEVQLMTQRRLACSTHVTADTSSDHVIQLGGGIVERPKSEPAVTVSPQIANFVSAWKTAAQSDSIPQNYEADQINLMRNLEVPIAVADYMLNSCPECFREIRSALAKAIGK